MAELEFCSMFMPANVSFARDGTKRSDRSIEKEAYIKLNQAARIPVVK